MSQITESQVLDNVDEVGDSGKGLKKRNRMPKFTIEDFQKGGPFFGVKVGTHCLPRVMMDYIWTHYSSSWMSDVKFGILSDLHSFLPDENRFKCSCELENDFILNSPRSPDNDHDDDDDPLPDLIV